MLKQIRLVHYPLSFIKIAEGCAAKPSLRLPKIGCPVSRPVYSLSREIPRKNPIAQFGRHIIRPAYVDTMTLRHIAMRRKAGIMVPQSPCPISESGPFDRCLTCPNLGSGCSGPRTTAMSSHERYIHWMRALRDLRRSQGWPVSNVQIAEACGLGKNTVDNFFAEKNKDVSRITAGRIEDYLIGGDAKWPCSMDLNKDKDVIFQDRPETLEALARRDKEVEEIHSSYKAELDSVRAEAQSKIEHLHHDIAIFREDAQKKIDYLKLENEFKAKVIERLQR